jgi:hypothetical protein
LIQFGKFRRARNASLEKKKRAVRELCSKRNLLQKKKRAGREALL